MDWASVFKIITAALVSAGGAGAIIVGCVKFLSNHIAERMLQKHKAELDKEIEKYKHDLEMETEKYRRKTERLTFVTKKQFDTEFSAYQEIFKCLHDFASWTASLYPVYEKLPLNKEEEKEILRNRYQAYCGALIKYAEVLEINAPFIPQEIYNMFLELCEQANKIAYDFPDIRIIDDPILERIIVKLQMRIT